jgi:hypothetical protein
MLEVTYGRLDQVLRGLGFSVRISRGDGFVADNRVYEHPESGAVIYLPVFPEEEKVIPRHLLAVRTTLDLFGVDDPLDFDAKLQSAG